MAAGRRKEEWTPAWKSDIDRSVIAAGAEQHGWRGAEDGEWNFYWLSVSSVRAFFSGEGMTLGPRQVVNHFPNHHELTRKDLMVRNLRRYFRERPTETVTTVSGQLLELRGDFLPQSYVLPSELTQFQEEFTKHPGTQWIFKPASRAQGKGISLLTRPGQVRALPATLAHLRARPGSAGENFVVCRYIADPWLIGGRKFDLRLYVLVTRYRPLIVWRYKEGFARFCLEDYALRTGADPNTALFAHLTNVSFQKQNADYDERHGGKWPFSTMMTHLTLRAGEAAAKKLQCDIDALFIKTLKAVQGQIVDCPHAFELYGFDVLIDSSLRPWLIEVNASPSLLTTTVADQQLKRQLLGDLMGVVLPDTWGRDKMLTGPATCGESSVGLFELIYAQPIAEESKARRPQRARSALPRYW